jgi:hypothetical protein
MLGAFIIKGAKDYMYTHKIMHPHDKSCTPMTLKNDYVRIII